MTADEAIQSAIDTMGAGQTMDYVISPTGHAQEFIQKAPDLAAILRSRAVITTAEQFENEDRDALAAQKTFRNTFSRANQMVLVTSILIALVLATGAAATTLPDPLEHTLLIILGLASVFTGALASRYLYLIKQGHLLETWMSKRASAETARLDYFDAVVRSPMPSTAPNVFSAELLKLEYFRRFQFDVQRVYYRHRSKDHREKAAKILSQSSWAIAGGACATGAAGMLGIIDARFAAIAAVGTIFTALSSFTAMQEAVYQDRRNAERYGGTSRVLEDLNKRLDEIRKAVATTGIQPLKDFVEAVHEQLSLEHRQWLGELGEARGAFATLERTLKELSSTNAMKSKSINM